jgi:hypothetical protein
MLRLSARTRGYDPIGSHRSCTQLRTTRTPYWQLNARSAGARNALNRPRRVLQQQAVSQRWEVICALRYIRMNESQRLIIHTPRRLIVELASLRAWRLAKVKPQLWQLSSITHERRE